MAQPVTPKCLRGCIIAPLVTIIVLILVIVIATVVVLNMTPDQLGIADVEVFDGETFRTLGLADIKFKDFAKHLDALLNANEDEIVQNPVDETAEKENADTAVEDSSVSKKSDGSIDYSSILQDKITYSTEQQITYKDTTLAYIFNQILEDGAVSNDDAVKFLKDINASISEVTISKNGGNATLRIVVCIDTKSIKEEVKSSLDEVGAGRYITIPDKVFLVSYQTLDVNADNALVTSSVSLKINDKDNPLSDAIFKVLAKRTQEVANQNNLSADTSKEAVNNEIGKAFVSIVTNLGEPVAINEHEIVVKTYRKVEIGVGGNVDIEIELPEVNKIPSLVDGEIIVEYPAA